MIDYTNKYCPRCLAALNDLGQCGDECGYNATSNKLKPLTSLQVAKRYLADFEAGINAAIDEGDIGKARRLGETRDKLKAYTDEMIKRGLDG